MAVQTGRVVDDEENFQDVAQADLRRVEHQFDDLVVPGGPATDLLVGDVGHMAVAVTALHVAHAAHIHVHRFGAPKAAAAKRDGFMGWVHGKPLL